MFSEKSFSRGRGRPPVPEREKKRPRNLSISDISWSNLINQVINLSGVGSVSELIEKIGLGYLKIVPKDQFDSKFSYFPLYMRLRILICSPVAMFASVISFICRTAKQLSLQNSDVLVYDVLMRMITIVFYIGYTHPDKYINNPGALMRWLVYYILLNRARGNKSCFSSLDYSQDSHSLLDNVQKFHVLGRSLNTVSKLKAASRSLPYQALKMKAIDQLTLSQIRVILELQGECQTQDDIQLIIEEGIAKLRESSGISWNDKFESEIPKRVNQYYNLAVTFPLDVESFSVEMEVLLRKAIYDSRLNYWISEIDYYIGEELFSDSSVDYKIYLEKVRQSVYQGMDSYLNLKKCKIDRLFEFCRTIGDVRRNLTKLVAYEVGGGVPFWQIYLFVLAVQSRLYSLMRYVSFKVGCSQVEETITMTLGPILD